ncbi:PadR family transcriptional regulator [Eupransor demetentiae]|uniref:PadR family (PadR) n=1 Tax=Eupransor demetentiae TaxID=3109584 RepID=A0ABM9N563_9LACO|nr:DNA-binding transcriptional regulator [Lactobacillaceae bacterium LMG 33000]
MKGQAIILGLLMKKPLTGYELRERIEEHLIHFYDGGYGMIYPTLKKLEAAGLVTKETVVQSDKPNKNIFAITPAGKAAFKEALEADLADDSFKSDYLLRLYFGEFLDKKELIALTQEKIRHTQSHYDALKSKSTNWDKSATPEQKFTYEFGLAQYENSLNLLRKELKLLEKYK